MKLNAKKILNLFYDFIFITLGSVLYAVCINALTAPNNIAPGGVTGIATLINYVLGTPIGVAVFIINIPIIICAAVQIGYKLVLKTSFAIVISSVLIDVFALFVPAYQGDLILVALMAGVLEGVGLALTFVRGATTGGTDMLARVLGKKHRHMSMGKIMLSLDGVVIVSSALIYKSIDSAIYACIVVFVSTRIIDAILSGTDIGAGKLFFIFSRKREEIAKKIYSELDRGVTYLKGKGGYTNEDIEIIMCAVRRYEIFKLHEIIKETDHEAFIIVGDAGEITGQGFKSIKSDDKTLNELMEKVKKER